MVFPCVSFTCVRRLPLCEEIHIQYHLGFFLDICSVSHQLHICLYALLSGFCPQTVWNKRNKIANPFLGKYVFFQLFLRSFVHATIFTSVTFLKKICGIIYGSLFGLYGNFIWIMFEIMQI